MDSDFVWHDSDIEVVINAILIGTARIDSEGLASTDQALQNLLPILKNNRVEKVLVSNYTLFNQKVH
jgi:hypothetical protein